MSQQESSGTALAESRPRTIRLTAMDVGRQKLARLPRCPVDISLSELVQDLLANMQLPPNDGQNRPVTYEARLEREGRSLQGSETVGGSLQDDDVLTLQPSVDAG